LDAPLYAMRAVKDQLFCLDREARARVISIDTTEARFKLALANKKVRLDIFRNPSGANNFRVVSPTYLGL